MPRFGSSSRPSAPSRNSSTATKPMTSVVPSSSSVPALVQAKPPTLLQSAKEGFGLGFGASIARNIVDRAFGSATAAVASAPVVASKPVVQYDTKLYEQCIENGATEEFCRQIASPSGIKSLESAK
jgi:hypothetical protein